MSDKLTKALRNKIANDIAEALSWMDQGPLNKVFENFCAKLKSSQELTPSETQRIMLLAGYQPNPEAISRPGKKEIEFGVSSLGKFEDLN